MGRGAPPAEGVAGSERESGLAGFVRGGRAGREEVSRSRGWREQSELRATEERAVGSCFFLSVGGARKPAMESMGACYHFISFLSIGKRLDFALAMETETLAQAQLAESSSLFL